MTGATEVSLQNSEFNTFLFAPIGEDRNGMLLSVLSALARMDVDPWHQADVLDRMPTATATETLTSLIAGLPDMAASHLDPRTIASRLIVLLPHRNGTGGRSPAGLSALSWSVPSGVLFVTLLVTFALGALFVVMTR